MALALQAKQRLSCRCARRTIKCRAAGASAPQKLQLAVATAAAASLLAAPAFAGVILTKPELKRVFVDDAPAAAAAKTTSAPKAKAAAAPAPKAESSESGEGFSLSPYTVALPGALVLVAGGGGFALKNDPEFLNKALMKDSRDLGAGYEETLKGGNVAALSVSKPKAGTKLFKKK